MKAKQFDPLSDEKEYKETPVQKLIREGQDKEAKAQRAVSAGEVIVPFNESRELRDKGAEVIACFVEDGVKKFKLKKPKEDKK